MELFENFDFKKISWFKVGGRVKKYFICQSIEELKEILDIIKLENKNLLNIDKIRIIGNCSNILMSDEGFDGAIIKFGNNFKNISIQEDLKIKCSSACLSTEVANFALQNSLSSLEFLYTIPGCIGGAVYMNAGCYGYEVQDVLSSVEILDLSNMKILNLERNDINFKYRESNLPKNYIILSATFNCKKEIQLKIKTKIEEMNGSRLKTQPIGTRTCGSTFRNTKDIPAWKLLDEVGLRGYKIGGASFSSKHSNFIVNEKDATSKDILDLINLAKERVREKFNIDLKLEIELF